MTLRARLTAAFLLVVLVPLLVGAALLAAALPRAVQERQEQGLTSSARLAALSIAELCGRARGAAEAAGRAAQSSDDRVLTAALQDLVQRDLADGLRVVDAAGRVRGSAGSAAAVPERDCTDGEVVRSGGDVQLAAVLRLSRAGTGPVGAVVASFSVDAALARRLQQAAGTGQVVLLAGGRPITSSGEVEDALVRAAVEAGNEPVVVGDHLAVVADAGPNQPVAVLLSQPRVQGVRLIRYALGVVLGAVLLATGIAFALARATTRPLEELGEAAARVASGDLSTSIEVRSKDEVGRLAGAFNSMTDDLRTYIGELQASRSELQAGVARLGDTLSATHDLDRILSVVLDTALASTRARAGAVLLLSADRRELELAVGHNLEERHVPQGLRLPLGAGISGGVARSGTPVRVGSGDADAAPAEGEPSGTALVAVPLKSSTTVIGVLLLWDHEGGEDFTDDDVATLRTFTSQATVAVDNVLLHEEARRLSITDGLTGLWNYRYFTMTIGKEIERAARFDRPLALLVLDLDHFKLVNDVFGHQRGDAVLVELAARVRAQVRDVDTLARYGGEEFVVVLPETDEDGAGLFAERIRAAVRRRPFGEAGEQQIDVTASIGVAVFPSNGATSTELLRRADEALYVAKRSGRDTWRLAVPEVTDDPAGRPS